MAEKSNHSANPGAQFNLDIFIAAQNQEEDGYIDAATQLRSGRKTSHWMWYIFPQAEGLSKSLTSRRFAIRSLDHARAYLHHSLLGYRLGQVLKLVLNSPVRDAEDLLDSEIDAQKLHACLTLFKHVAGEEDKEIFQLVLDKYFEAKTHEMTNDILRVWAGERAEESGYTVG